jgi:hypothetical protein
LVVVAEEKYPENKDIRWNRVKKDLKENNEKFYKT